MNDVYPKKVVECHNNYENDTLEYGQKKGNLDAANMYIAISLQARKAPCLKASTYDMYVGFT